MIIKKTNNIKYIYNLEKNETLDIISVYFSLVIIIFICLIIYSFSGIFFKSKIPADYPIWDFVSPEPAERLMYIISLIIFPFLFYFIRRLLMKRFKYFANEIIINNIHNKLLLFSVFLIFLIFIVDFSVKLRHTDTLNIAYNYIKYTLLDKNIMASLFLTLSIGLFLFILNISEKYFLIKYLIYNKIYIIIDLFVIFVLFILSFIHIDKIYDFYHFDAMFYSVSQVYNGKNVLVNTISQYGLYAHFLKPLFYLMGGANVWNFKIIMSLMIFLSFIFIYFFLRIVIKDKILLFLSIIALIYYSYVNFYIGYRNREYYQYFPLRSFFPMLFLFLSAIYFKIRNIFLYFFISILLPFSMLWNPDTGLILLLSWIGVLIYSEILEQQNIINLNLIKKIFFHIINIIVISFLCILLYGLLIFLNAGKFPDFSKLFLYQKIYYGIGFGLIPMTLFHPWNLIILVYTLGLSMALSKLTDKNSENNYINIIIFLLSIMGFGLFIYYQGRSHDWALVPLLYIPIIICGIFGDRLLNENIIYFKNNFYNVGKILLFLFILLILFAPMNNLINTINKFDFKNFKEKFNIKNRKEFFPELKKYFKPGEDVYIISGVYQSIIYSETKTKNPIDIPGQIELTLHSDMVKLRNFLAEYHPGRKIIWDKTDGGEYVNHYELKFNNNYQIIATQPNTHILVLKQLENSDIKPLFLTNKNTLFHIKNFNRYVYSLYDNKGNFKYNFIFDSKSKIKFNNKLMIEMILYAEENEPIGIDICGNKKENSGFVFSTDKYKKDYYKFIWKEQYFECSSPSFYLEPRKFHYLVLSYDTKNINLYIDGNKIFVINGFIYNSDETIKFADQWSGYKGYIDELCISRKIKAEEEIQNSYEHLNHYLFFKHL